ncbi:MAG: outer membrane beta-barrel protein [Holosporaceae bacterium]|nr:outer membrane beta-barrel protein [Holosporaceae bacterium]
MKKVLAAVMGALVFSAGADEAVISEDLTSAGSEFSGVYFGLGVGGNFVKNKADYYLNNVFLCSIADHRINRFVGTVVFGGGKTFANKFYVGGEFLLDFAKLSSYNIGFTNCKVRGIVPELALRLGYVKNDLMFYVKPGVSFVNYSERDIRDGREGADISKAVYSLGLGVEKTICKKFSTRLECEYLFPAKKKFRQSINYPKANYKIHNGFNLRALVVYNVKL